jgi:hypothetical protein
VRLQLFLRAINWAKVALFFGLAAAGAIVLLNHYNLGENISFSTSGSHNLIFLLL